MQKDDVRSFIFGVLAKESEKQARDITEDTLLQGELGIGTQVGRVEFLELKEDLERQLGVRIPDDKLPDESTLPALSAGELVDLFANLLESKQAA